LPRNLSAAISSENFDGSLVPKALTTRAEPKADASTDESVRGAARMSVGANIHANPGLDLAVGFADEDSLVRQEFVVAICDSSSLLRPLDHLQHVTFLFAGSHFPRNIYEPNNITPLFPISPNTTATSLNAFIGAQHAHTIRTS
jgi:hypothetical protein